MRAPGRRARRRQQTDRFDAAHGDGGSAALELVVLFPFLLAAIFGLFQGSMYYHARSVASSAATLAAIEASAEGSCASTGESAALAQLSRAGGSSVLVNPAVDVDVTGTTVTVTVSGTAPLVLAGFIDLPVSQSAAASVERVTQ